MKKLFPKYLDRGSKGTAVDALHIILCSLGFGAEIIRDGEYGTRTVSAVKQLQVRLGFSGDNVDGNFGPATRRALMEQMNIDLDAVPYSSQYDRENTWCGPDHEGSLPWNGEGTIAEA